MSALVFTAVRLVQQDALSAPTTVVVEDGRITAVGDDAPVPAGAETVDGGGRTLLPGLIDAHVHVARRADLDALAAHGVTTAFDMGSWPAELTAALRAETGTTRILSAGVPFIGPAGAHSHFGMPEHATLTDPAQAAPGVRRRLDDGSDVIKVVTEPQGAGGPTPDAVRAVVAAAHEAGAQVVAHAAHADSFRMSVEAGADVITHVPLGAAVDDALAARTPAAVPTLTVAKALTTAMPRPGADYAVARESVAALHRAGVPIAAGTDAVDAPGVPFAIPHGASLHQELELLVEAGLTPVEALRSAGVVAARMFGLTDRGEIASGLRADLVLVDGDPAADITAARNVHGVWISGEPVTA